MRTVIFAVSVALATACASSPTQKPHLRDANANSPTKLAQNDASELNKRVAKVASAARPLVRVAPQGMQLPKTATDAELRMMAGLALMVLSLILLMLTRRRMFV